MRYDDGTYNRLWIEVVQAILNRRTVVNGQMVQAFTELRNYPALLALRCASIESVNRGRDEVLIGLLTTPRWDDAFNRNRSTLAADVLHPLNLIDEGHIDGLPRWENRRDGSSQVTDTRCRT